MLIRVTTDIILEVPNDDEAESASHDLDMGLDGMLTESGFPHDVVVADVQHWAAVSDEEANEKGWVE